MKTYSKYHHYEKKKKIAFVSPIGRGGPTILYENLTQKLNEKYAEILECEHIHSISWWIWCHFSKKYDIIVSVIPFLWRPNAQKFFLNVHGDFEKEKNTSSSGHFLIHFYPKNVKMADDVIFPSFWLANKISPNKQKIIYNIISDFSEKNWKISSKNEFFTITSFHFYDKCKGILSLISDLESISKPYIFHIFGGGKYFEAIKNQIPKTKNEIIFHNFLPKEEIFSKIPKNAIFLYRSELDIIPTTILEAIKNNFPVLIGFLPQFEEFFDKKILYKNQEDFQKKLENIAISKEILKKFDTEKNLEKWKNLFFDAF